MPDDPTQPRANAAGQTRWLTAQDVADLYGVSRQWVYENKTRIGYSRLSDGPGAHIRFSADDVERHLTQRSYDARPKQGRRTRASHRVVERVERVERIAR